MQFHRARLPPRRSRLTALPPSTRAPCSPGSTPRCLSHSRALPRCTSTPGIQPTGMWTPPTAIRTCRPGRCPRAPTPTKTHIPPTETLQRGARIPSRHHRTNSHLIPATRVVTTPTTTPGNRNGQTDRIGSCPVTEAEDTTPVTCSGDNLIAAIELVDQRQAESRRK